jgi:hypothetical protein
LWDTQHRDYKYRENKMLHFFKWQKNLLLTNYKDIYKETA